jgi:hypothetical protein
MKSRLQLAVLLIASMFLTSLIAEAQQSAPAAMDASNVVPSLINYTGVLKDTSGRKLTSVTGVTFLLYSAEQGGAPLWLETQNVTPDKSGRYAVQLGVTIAKGVPSDLFVSGEARWLAVQIGSEAEQPRIMLLSVPYALKAGDAETVGGIPASAFQLARPQSGVGGGAGTSAKAASPNVISPAITGTGSTNYVPLWTSSTNLGVSVLFQSAGKIGIGTTSPGVKLDVNGNARVRNNLSGTTATFGANNAGQAFTITQSNAFGLGLISTAPAFALAGNATSGIDGGIGVQGNAFYTGSGTTFGVMGTAASSTGIGVEGQINTPGGIGVQGGNASSTGGTGVEGLSLGTGGTGVAGLASGTGSFAIQGNNSNSTSGVGVAGLATGNIGIGVQGQATDTSGTGEPIGVVGQSSSSTGVGILGNALSTTGSTVGIKGLAASTNGIAVLGQNGSASGNTFGVKGEVTSVDGRGVLGQNDSTTNFNVAVGVEGRSMSQTYGIGVLGNGTYEGMQANGGTIGIIASGPTTGYAGFFNGNVFISGTLSKGGGSFKIDHPLDPKNKYLSHSFVESPDMMNIYDGVAVLDSKGEAWVSLPDWFDSLNRDFRYQLTAIGVPAPKLHIAREISGNRFKIAGGKQGGKICWQVTGIRHDAYANAYRIPVEEQKPAEQQGYYLHPELFGQPASRAIGALRNPAPVTAASKSGKAAGLAED